MSSHADTHDECSRAGILSTRSGGKLHALVVDDEPTMVTLSSLMLKNFGFEVDTASNGIDAISWFKVKNYNLVLTDLVMPKMNGYELAIWIRQNFKKIFVLIMTGSNCDQVQEMMDSKIADGWLFKPFIADELEKVIRDLFVLA